MGSKVTSYKLGDMVMVPYNDPDPEVFGEINVGYGAFAEYAVANDLAAYIACGEEAPSYAAGQTVFPDDIDPVDGASVKLRIIGRLTFSRCPVKQKKQKRRSRY